MRNKKFTRTCTVCRNKFENSSMHRIAYSGSNFCVTDKKQDKTRSLYVCKNNECIDKLKSKKILNRVLRKDISMEVYDKILEELKLANK